MTSVSPPPSTTLSSLSKPACDVAVLTSNAPRAATRATSTRPITFMFSLSHVDGDLQRSPCPSNVVVRLLAPRRKSSQMRTLSCCPYRLLIVDTRNISVAPAPGNGYRPARSHPGPPVGGFAEVRDTVSVRQFVDSPNFASENLSLPSEWMHEPRVSRTKAAPGKVAGHDSSAVRPPPGRAG